MNQKSFDLFVKMGETLGKLIGFVLGFFLVMGMSAPNAFAADLGIADVSTFSDSQIEALQGFSHLQVSDDGSPEAVFQSYVFTGSNETIGLSNYRVILDPAALSKNDVESITTELSGIFAGNKLATTVGPGSDYREILVECDQADSAEVHKLVRELSLSVPITFEIEPQTNQLESNVLGGWDLDGECTGAFMGYIDGQLGVLTARHCIFSWEYFAYGSTWVTGHVVSPDPELDVAFVYVMGTSNGYAKTAGDIVPPITPNGIVEPIIGGRDPRLNEQVCHFGIGSGKSCTKVILLNQKVTYTSGLTCKSLAVTQSMVSAPGDSGGPWYTNATSKTALGSHTGTFLYQGVLRSAFTVLSAANILNIDYIFAGMQ
ncbi:MAG: hypothetical protein F2854_02615 [Actinobacteria bacterium]|nr:hypothetical protein [Actinomycetota bacterium]